MESSADPFGPVYGEPSPLAAERALRAERWRAFQERIRGRERPRWVDLRDGYIFRPRGQGIWLDSERTRAAGLPEDHALSVLLTDRYDEEGSEIIADRFNYSYPRGHDTRSLREIAGMRAAQRSVLPIFFVDGLWYPYNVRVAWVVKFNDESGLFLLGFSAPNEVDQAGGIDDEAPYPESRVHRRINATRIDRPQQARFVFDVYARYGVQCAICPIDVRQVLTAAHVRPVGDHGPDDARNGLVLCSSHHVAFDKGLVRINPRTLAVEVALEASAVGLGVTRPDLTHLRRLPRDEEIVWRYSNYVPYQKRAWTHS